MKDAAFQSLTDLMRRQLSIRQNFVRMLKLDPSSASLFWQVVKLINIHRGQKSG
jgi:hypothetical protein